MIHTWQKDDFFFVSFHLGTQSKEIFRVSKDQKLSLLQILSKTFNRRTLCSRYTHISIMAAPNALLLSSKGAGASAKFVQQGSRRKGPNKKSSTKKSCVRAGFFSKDDDFERTTTEEEQSSSSSSSSSLAGKAVSAVVAAAISLSSAGQAAVASSSQVMVRVSFSQPYARDIYFSFLNIKERSDRFGYDDGFHL